MLFKILKKIVRFIVFTMFIFIIPILAIILLASKDVQNLSDLKHELKNMIKDFIIDF